MSDTLPHPMRRVYRAAALQALAEYVHQRPMQLSERAIIAIDGGALRLSDLFVLSTLPVREIPTFSYIRSRDYAAVCKLGGLSHRSILRSIDHMMHTTAS